MKIHELKIEGFKSIGSITLTEPNPFSVFVGPNASGKSNIFEALEFMQLCNTAIPSQVAERFGNVDEILNRVNNNSTAQFSVDLGKIKPYLRTPLYTKNFETWRYIHYGKMFHITNPPLLEGLSPEQLENNAVFDTSEYLQFTNYTRLFVGNTSKTRENIQNDSRLASDALNLERVLKRIFKDVDRKEEILEILQLLIPGFSNVEIRTEELSGSDSLLVYESALEKPLTKRLISDGTYNILAILAAIYQSDEPQFLCIEEPENGLNPKVVKLLVDLFREKCKEKGHYIWINTHSQSLVAELTPEEIILVDKKNGLTQVKQIKGKNLHGLRMDDALMTNTLGGGIPW